MGSIRPAAVAGYFYPADPVELSDLVRGFLERSGVRESRPRAVVAPHAGYAYSGAVAGAAYASLGKPAGSVRRVVLLGPPHRMYVRGFALPRADAFDTPLGSVPIDREMRAWMLDFPGVIASDAPHAMEHSIEVQLPFLQSLLGEFELTPILVGDVPPETVETLIDRVLRTPETLLVVSSDLSHYHPYREAQALDRSTTAAIVNRRYEDIGPEQACGCRALNGLLRFAITQQLNVAALSYCNSGDTAGPRDRVVGYGAYAVG